MHFMSLIDTKRVAFGHREGDINSYENESDKDLPCVGRHALRATGLLTEDIHVTASSNGKTPHGTKV